MTDKTGKVGGKKKVGTVDDTAQSDKVEQSTGVGQVGALQKTGAVSSVKGTDGSAKGGSGRVYSVQEREKLFKMVDEEAKKLFGKSAIPKGQREVIEKAVKMAIDAGLREENDDGEAPKDKKK